MLFNSFVFILVFAPVVYALYWSRRNLDERKWVLVAASYVFYAAWSAKFALLMLATTSVDYFTARRIAACSGRPRRTWLVVSLACNLGVLAVFKYFNFFMASAGWLFGRESPHLDIVLPIGISFYTFESMSYTIDVYRGQCAALDRFIDYAHFVTMFPRLVAGPIVRYSELAAQLRDFRSALVSDDVVHALFFFTVGMAKKLFIADVLAAALVDPLFAGADRLTATAAWVAGLAYTAQLYFDFSGYSDMACGLAILLGLRFPRNFNLPYRALNVSEFWRRWHISLSSWLRDYLFIPLGGSRGAGLRTTMNVTIVMLLGGLWHGASWSFVLWGGYHGLGLLVHRAFGPRVPLSATASRALTFLFVVCGWILFRATSLGQAAAVYRAMAGFGGASLTWAGGRTYAIALMLASLLVAFSRDTYDLRPPRTVPGALALGCLLGACMMQLSRPSPFLYFQF